MATKIANHNRALERRTSAVDLAWNVMKDYFFWQGITGPRDATREAFNKEIIEDGEGWMEMVKSRNQTSHTYNLEIAAHIVKLILESYHPLFVAFAERMRGLTEAQ